MPHRPRRGGAQDRPSVLNLHPCAPPCEVENPVNRQQRQKARESAPTINPVTALWFSNAPWAGTGYGTQTAQVVERMKRDGHHVAVSANYGLQAMTTEWNGIPIYPMGFENYSNDVAAANFRHWSLRHPDTPAHLFVLFDAWVLKGKHWDELPASIWTMVDHMPVPVAVADVLKKPNITPIAVTEFGRNEIERQGIAAEYIPMAIDTSLYTATETFEGVTGRQMMGLPEDTFVCSIVNANKGLMPVRKSFAENILAFSIFAAKHPDARLYIHSERHGNMGGIQFDPLIRAVGLKPHQYAFVNQYAQHVGIPNEAMAALYTASDVMLAASMSEGFGLTVLEAASCGTRVIANDFSAQPEMVSEDSWLTEGQPYWDPSQFAWMNTPNIPSIVDALEEAYRKGHGRSQAQRDHAMKYDADLIWDTHWRPYMARVASGDIGGSTSALPDIAPLREWSNGAPSIDARLTIYIPTYKRPEIATLLTSLAPQLSSKVEVIISDNDPAGSALPAVVKALNGADCFVDYSRRTSNIGGESNIVRGYEVGHADWVWVIGDDDLILPGAVANVLEAIDHDDVDRLILLSRSAPSKTAGMIGSLPELAAIDPGLLVAATLVTANVVRRRALDMASAAEHMGTMYAHSFANTTCHRVRVLNEAGIAVGRAHANEFAEASGFSGNVLDIWTDLLHAYGIETVGDEHFSWNFLSV